MDFDTKAAHRKSKAPWQLPSGNNSKVNNPYANASVNLPGENTGDSLQIPNPYANKSTNNKRTRRLSIHASASAAAHTKNLATAANLPPVPQLPDLIPQTQKDEDNIHHRIINDLANATATEIDDYYKVLQKQKEVVDRDIKDNINQNQKHILELMTDLKNTQDELLQLRISSKDLYTVLDEFRDSAERRLALEEKLDDRSPYGKKTKRKDRSSIMILEKMWVSELQSLFKHVEGASKFIQSVQGRHVLAESGRWFEVNLGNWKAIKAIHIFVLNDLILIATKKTSTVGNKGSSSRLQAVHCWPLHELQLQVINQTNATEDKVYFVQVTVKSVTYVFQTDRYDHFVKITEAYNKGKNELLQKDRLYDVRSVHEDGFETDDEKRQLVESLRNSGVFDDDTPQKRRSGSHRHSDILLQDISARVHSRNRSNDFSANGKFSRFTKTDKGQFFNELKRVEDRLDEVDVEIAHNKFHEGVGLINYIENKVTNVERIVGKSDNETYDSETLASLEEVKLLMDVIKIKIANRKADVQHSLSFNLKNNISKLKTSEIGEILEFFYSFGVLDKGITSFLQATTTNLAGIISKLVLTVQGSTKTDVGNYISNMVIIYVSVMKKTIHTYKECIFPILERDNDGAVDSSGLINWCIEEGNKLIGAIKKQLLGSLLVAEDDEDDTNTKLLIKDRHLFESFLSVLKPQLEDLKSMGINIEFLFDDISNAEPIGR